MSNSNLPNSATSNTFPASDLLSAATSLLNMGNFDKLVIDKKRCSIQITGKDESGCVNTINHTTTPAANRLALTRLNTNDRKIRNDEIIRMYNQGYTQTAIAAETGLSQSGVHNILKKAGVI